MYVLYNLEENLSNGTWHQHLGVNNYMDYQMLLNINSKVLLTVDTKVRTCRNPNFHGVWLYGHKVRILCLHGSL